jgi:hypothetical protein
MNPINSLSLLQDVMPDEVNLHILSFLGKRDVESVACTCTRFEDLSKDFQIWRPKAEEEFGRFIAHGAKQFDKSWKKIYEELNSSREARVNNIGNVLHAHVKKTRTDDIQYRTQRATTQLFGFPMPNPNAHNYLTGQTGFLGDRKITVYKSHQG